MIAVFVNCGAVIVGALLGVLFSKKINNTMSDVVSTGAGLVTFALGIQMALGYRNVVYLALAVILGGICGTWLDIDAKILRFGGLLERAFRRPSAAATVNSGKKNFAAAFLNASVLFCVGAMSILGSIQAGVEGKYTIIFTKSVLDFFLAIVIASAQGVGAAFSALSILLYQGALTLLASAVSSVVSEQMLSEVSASGGILLLMIGINLSGLRTIKTANYLPSLFFSILFVLAFG